MQQLDEKYLISDSIRKKLNDEEFLRREAEKGDTMQHVLGFSDEAMYGFYEAANRLMEERRFEDATDAFFFLTQLAPHVKPFWLGMGYCEWNNNRPEQALIPYFMALALEDGDKEVYLACMRCCLAAGKPEEAIKILEMALEFVEQHPDAPSAQQLHDTAVSCKEWITKNHLGRS